MMVFAQSGSNNPDIFNGSTQDRVDALAKIQPGLGTIMIEYGDRITNTYYAAQGGNWGLAQYQLHEATEIQEVGEITRPEHAEMLKAVEHSYLDPLNERIMAMDWPGFQQAFDTMVTQGCNACHAATGHSYIEYKLPPQPAESYLNFDLSTQPTQP
ncbi:MAG: hypothetical protein P8Y13_15570 [Deinococcales bacterium]